MIRDGSASEGDIRRVVKRLVRFYRDAAPMPMTSARYRAEFAHGMAENRRELSIPAYGLPADVVATLCVRQGALLASRPELFDQRVSAGRIIEAHGDLRPEHICLDGEPQIIDCLEFSHELRILDAADELAFFALECERLGAPRLAATVFAAYADESGDMPPAALLEFYQSYRACVRAKIAIRHLNDPAPREPARWAAQARDYLRLASGHIERAM
jgi:aminoglycoside phosphotransferase family enzyme